ncbi:MAG: hypothetical protein U0547_04120 [Dehalococcoidia bacterium]
MPLNPDDLAPLEVALLGVLCVGLPPSKAAGDDRFRIDHVTAVVSGLQSEGRAEVHLQRDGLAVSPEFRAALRETILALTEKGVLADQAPGMPAAAGNFEAGLEVDMVQPDEHPALLDRYLGQLCMEVLFNIPAVYPYLMGRYAASGEVWRRLRDAGYGN